MLRVISDDSVDELEFQFEICCSLSDLIQLNKCYRKLKADHCYEEVTDFMRQIMVELGLEDK